MTVKELRDYLYRCNDDFIVKDSNGDPVKFIIEHKDIVEGTDSYVEIS